LESNQRPPPYQGGALPTELSERLFQPSSMTAKNRPASCWTFQLTSAVLHDGEEQTSILAGLFNNKSCAIVSMERETGIEPALVAWKATVLPLNYSRPGVLRYCISHQNQRRFISSCQRRAIKSGGGRWITPGILPFAPPGPALRAV
jgi:hypothetical protein